jgi:hypothetical protein
VHPKNRAIAECCELGDRKKTTIFDRVELLTSRLSEPVNQLFPNDAQFIAPHHLDYANFVECT